MGVQKTCSCSLVISLSLTTEKHPHPYLVSWIKKDMDSQVTEVCYIFFLIGKFYQDEITCDVLEMDACHFLLDRPWQFNVNALHHGQENTYSFVWKGKKIILLPVLTLRHSMSSDKNKATLYYTVPSPQFLEEVTPRSQLIALLFVE